MKKAQNFYDAHVKEGQDDNSSNKRFIILDNMKPIPSKSCKLYVDAGFHDKKATCGIIMIDKGKVVAYLSRVAQSSVKSSTSAELWAVMEAIKFAVGDTYNDIEILYDCEAVVNIPKNENEYKTFLTEMSKKANIRFAKVKAHSGNKHNELADKIAGLMLKSI